MQTTDNVAPIPFFLPIYPRGVFSAISPHPVASSLLAQTINGFAGAE